MRLPTVHLNGTSRAELLRMNREALTAVQQALASLRAAGPHGRDYYTQEGDAINEAIAEHRERCKKLDVVCNEIEEICLSLLD